MTLQGCHWFGVRIPPAILTFSGVIIVRQNLVWKGPPTVKGPLHVAQFCEGMALMT